MKKEGERGKQNVMNTIERQSGLFPIHDQNLNDNYVLSFEIGLF